VQAAADPQLDSVRSGRIRQRLLQLQRRFEGVDRVIKSGVGAIAAHLYDDAAVRIDGGTHDGVVAGQGDLHALVVTIPKASAALDVGEQERRDPG
jgi:hypothetical protein